MKKFKKMLVALCLCVCVALSAGLVGCADSKTLAEIDDLKAKIEQKDTTIAEKDAKIKDLTLTDLQKISIMMGAFKDAEERSYRYSEVSSKSNAILGNISTNGLGSNFEHFLHGFGGNMYSGFEQMQLLAYNGKVNKDKLIDICFKTESDFSDNSQVTQTYINYSKDKYELVTISTSYKNANIVGSDVAKCTLILDNGVATKLIVEGKNQTINETTGKVDVSYCKSTNTFDQDNTLIYDWANTRAYFEFKLAQYTTDKFSMAGSEVALDEAVDVKAVTASGEVRIKDGVSYAAVKTVSLLYGFTIAADESFTGTGVSDAHEEFNASTAITSTTLTTKEAAAGVVNSILNLTIIDLSSKEVIDVTNIG